MTLLAEPVMTSMTTVACASMLRVGRYVEMLDAALRDDPRFYGQLVRRGFLENAIEHARHAHGSVDDDGIRAVHDDVIEALLAARDRGVPVIAEPALIVELQLAGVAAADAASALSVLAGHATSA